MKEKFYDTLLSVLKTDSRFFSSDGEFLRNAVYEAAMNLDENLIRILLDNPVTKERFFKDINGFCVFDKVEFTWTINNKELLPDSYTRFKNKIGLVDSNGDLISNSDKVELVFPYKDCVLEGGQTKEDQDRDEIFYNETLAPDEVDHLLYPKVFTNAKRYTSSGVESTTSFSEDDNLIIKGNNLLVLSSLLERYENRIKCIYIDPPYNPRKSKNNSFHYNNSFNRSTFLVFLKTRLQYAKKLLNKEKGVLIVTIDKNEQPRVQLLIEEIFNDGYDIDCITIVHNPRGTEGTNFSYTNEFAIFVTPLGKKVICNRSLNKDEIDWSPLRNWGSESQRSDAKNCFYPIIVENEKIVGFGPVCDDSFHPSKQTIQNGNQYYVYPIDTNGIERKWRYARQSVDEIKHLLRTKKIKGGYDIEIGKDFGLYKTVWMDPKYDANAYGTQLLTKLGLGGEFSNPKSLYNVMDCVNAVVDNDKNAIVLDFFAGSGTTGQAVMELNKVDGGHRRFILVEQMDYAETVTLQRNLNVINQLSNNDSICYFELAKLNQNFIDRLEKTSNITELGTIYNEMIDSGFISYKINPSTIDLNGSDYNALSFSDKKKFLLEILDKNLLYVNYCDIDDEEFHVSENDKIFTKSFYGGK